VKVARPVRRAGRGNPPRREAGRAPRSDPYTEIPTGAGKLYLATVIDLYSRRLLGAATSRHPDADLACAAIRMAIAVRGGTDAIRGVIFLTAAPR